MLQHGALEFRDVGFAYPGAEHPVLRNISFAVAPGQTTAIVGSTGAGKSTLVNLISRLFDSTEGNVLVGGVDVRDLDPDVLWSTIGYVPQRPYLFSGTVASNLQFGKPDATEEEMWSALEVAQAKDFVSANARRLTRSHRTGRHQRFRRATAAPLDCAGADPQARHLRVRRLVLGARPRNRRPVTGRARSVHTRSGGGHRRPARVDHHQRRQHRRPRGRRDRRQRSARRSARNVRDLREIVQSQIGEQDAA